MPFGWATAAIAKSEEIKAVVGSTVVAVIFDGLGDLGRRAVGDVGVGGGEMGEYFAPVDALPVESVVGDFIGGVPTHFLSEEGFDIEFFEDLGESGRVAEDIGQEHIDAVDAEFFFEIGAAVEELPDQAFSAGEVAIGFDPHAADGFPVVGFDGGFDAFEQCGVFLFEPFVLTGLGVDEKVARVAFGETKLDAGCVSHFEMGDVEGPKPGRVEVGVAHGVDGVGGFACDAPEDVLDEPSAFSPRFAIVFLEGVADFVEGTENCGVARIVFGKRFHEVVGKFSIVEEGEPFFIEERDFESVVGFGLGGSGFFGSEYGGFFVVDKGLYEVVDFRVGGVESEEFVGEIEAADLRIVLPEGSFNVGGVLP